MNNRFFGRFFKHVATRSVLCCVALSLTMGVAVASTNPNPKSKSTTATVAGSSQATSPPLRRVIHIPANLNMFAAWAIAAVTAGVVIGFFVGTSFTRRRILKSILEKNQVREGQGLGTARVRKRRKQWLTEVLKERSDPKSTRLEGVESFMNDEVEAVDVEDHINLAVKLMNERNVDCVYVCDGYHTIAGLITKSDVHSKTGVFARDIMTTDIVSVSPTATLAEAIEKLLSSGHSQLPVCLGTRLRGDFSLTDVAILHDCMFDVIDEITSELRDESFA